MMSVPKSGNFCYKISRKNFRSAANKINSFDLGELERQTDKYTTTSVDYLYDTRNSKSPKKDKWRESEQNERNNKNYQKRKARHIVPARKLQNSNIVWFYFFQYELVTVGIPH